MEQWIPHALVFIAVLVVAYFAGFNAGKVVAPNDSGWAEEARWWRKNAIGLRDVNDREHGN